MSYPVRGAANTMQRPAYISAPPIITMPPMIVPGMYRRGGPPLLPPPPTPGTTTAAAVAVATANLTNNNPPKPDLPEGPPVTVFVGNINPRAPDTMIRYILTACGPIASWKRVSSFGFCEFTTQEAGLRCVRLLHDRDIGGKKLVARIDAKALPQLEHEKSEQKQKIEKLEKEDGLDEQQKALDASTLERILQIIAEYQDDMKNYEAIQLEEEINKRNRILQEADIEEEKRDVIHREIGKFREIMKVMMAGYDDEG